MDSGGVFITWRQPQIIRSVAVLALAALGVARALAAQLPNDPHAPGVPCVSCLVIGLDAAVLDSASLTSGSLDGVRLLVSDDARDAKRTAKRLRAAENSGATVAVLIVAPANVRNMDEVLFGLRTAITELRAADAGVQIVIDGDAFAAVGLPLEAL